MKRDNNILDELKNMGSFLADLPVTMPYTVPMGYFENLASSTQQILNDIDSAKALPAWGKTMPHHVPAGYFENLAGNIIAKANSKNALPGLTTEIPFTVPAGYFETLPAQILKAAKAGDPVKKKAKIIQFPLTYSIRSVRWAAAAILLICIGFGGFFYLEQPSSDTEKILASIPKTEIEDYLQHTYRIDVNRVVNDNVSNLQVDNKEIVEYLNETGWDVTE